MNKFSAAKLPKVLTVKALSCTSAISILQSLASQLGSTFDRGSSFPLMLADITLELKVRSELKIRTKVTANILGGQEIKRTYCNCYTRF